ncbi:hypothetical protein L7F22_044976 [Adiantum nelumboides]|nr:hypothetical protein [Adiantum nelumboides]
MKRGLYEELLEGFLTWLTNVLKRTNAHVMKAVGFGPHAILKLGRMVFSLKKKSGYPFDPGLSDNSTRLDTKKLNDVGLCTIEAVAYSPKKDLLQIKNLSEAKVEKIIEAVQCPSLFASILVSQFHGQRCEILQISSGSKELDKILQGVWCDTGSVTETYGEFRTRKTQLCHTSPTRFILFKDTFVVTRLPLDQGGVDGKALNIDANGVLKWAGKWFCLAVSVAGKAACRCP